MARHHQPLRPTVRAGSPVDCMRRAWGVPPGTGPGRWGGMPVCRNDWPARPDCRGSARTLAALPRVVDQVKAGVYGPNIDRVFGLDDIAAAHRHMENNQATGKLVVVP